MDSTRETYSSFDGNLRDKFLLPLLDGAVKYDRVAGYLSSSILALADEVYEMVDGKIRIVCNDDLKPEDVLTAYASKVKADLFDYFQQFPDMKVTKKKLEQLKRFQKLLEDDRLEIRVVGSNDGLGFIHAKMGVVTKSDGSQVAFTGSINETFNAFLSNFENVWTDSSNKVIEATQGDFERLWERGRPLDKMIVQDIVVSAQRVPVDLPEWIDGDVSSPAPILLDIPVEETTGLWEHQKFFINHVWQEHLRSDVGMRFVLADMVGLGKTLQLGGAAKLVASYEKEPVLILVPNSLCEQWQEELKFNLAIPSARWDKDRWICENGDVVRSDIMNCPRRIAIVSHSVVMTRGGNPEKLLSLKYSLVICDEAHHARRSTKMFFAKASSGLGNNIDKLVENQVKYLNKTPFNNLALFLFKLSVQTKGMLLATATPIQLNPMELYDLLAILAYKNDTVLGDSSSLWKKNPQEVLNLFSQKTSLPFEKMMEYIANPFLPETDDRKFGIIRDNFGLNKNDDILTPEQITEFLQKPNLRQRIEGEKDEFFYNHNPLTFRVIRRTRIKLEEQGLLEKINVNLRKDGSVEFNLLQENIYQKAIELYKLLQKRVKAAGFIKILILRRICSSLASGKITVDNLLENNKKFQLAYAQKNINNEDDDFLIGLLEEFDDDLENEELNKKEYSEIFHNMPPAEITLLEQMQGLFNDISYIDPKFVKTKELFIDEETWIKDGTILFSQYYDTAKWFYDSLIKEFPDVNIGLYTSSIKSRVYIDGIEESKKRSEIKDLISSGKIQIIIGTDAASEGLNLQRLRNLLNIDLPWNPTRLEQREGRIKRPGQIHKEINVINLRYKGTVEDRVYQLLDERFKNIADIFGDIPTAIKTTWEDAIENEENTSGATLNILTKDNPFDIPEKLVDKDKIGKWNECINIVSKKELYTHLLRPWQDVVAIDNNGKPIFIDNGNYIQWENKKEYKIITPEEYSHKTQNGEVETLSTISSTNIKPQGMGFMEAAVEIMKDAKNPMSPNEIWNEVNKRNLVNTNGATPKDTMGARLGTNTGKTYNGYTILLAQTNPKKYIVEKVGSGKTLKPNILIFGEAIVKLYNTNENGFISQGNDNRYYLFNFDQQLIRGLNIMDLKTLLQYNDNITPILEWNNEQQEQQYRNITK